MKVHLTVNVELRLVQLELTGHLTSRSADAARRVLNAVTAAGLRHVIIDVGGLDDVDPRLAFVFLEFSERLAHEGGWLWLVHGAGNAGSSLRGMGVHDRVRSSPSRAAAGWVGARVGDRDAHPGTVPEVMSLQDTGSSVGHAPGSLPK